MLLKHDPGLLQYPNVAQTLRHDLLGRLLGSHGDLSKGQTKSEGTRGRNPTAVPCRVRPFSPTPTDF